MRGWQGSSCWVPVQMSVTGLGIHPALPTCDVLGKGVSHVRGQALHG